MIKKHLEIKTYNAYDIDITIKIDYDKEEISLVEKETDRSHLQGMPSPQYVNKSWVFVGRGLEYMQGWENILEAMKYAIKEASKELSSYLKEVQKEKEDEVCDVLDLATAMVKKGRVIKHKKK